jgi:phosphatidylethanolamine-binding protein (PEBP) family uncharacterized protein
VRTCVEKGLKGSSTEDDPSASSTSPTTSTTAPTASAGPTQPTTEPKKEEPKPEEKKPTDETKPQSADSTPSTTPTTEPPLSPSSMVLSSDALNPGEKIPVRFTCDGEQVSPPFSIRNVPPDAKSLVLLLESGPADRSTPPTTRWMSWNISPETTEIAEGKLPTGATTVNHSGEGRYSGPCDGVPGGGGGKDGGRHTYVLIALSKPVDLPAKATRAELDRAIAQYTRGRAELPVITEPKDQPKAPSGTPRDPNDPYQDLNGSR